MGCIGEGTKSESFGDGTDKNDLYLSIGTVFASDLKKKP
jgi:hypothetical protein